MTLSIVGSRTFTNYDLLEHEVDLFVEGKEIKRIISGGAQGADKLAEEYARRRKLEIAIIKPDWNKFGRAAGIIRNEDIINGSNYVIAFWDGKSKGTQNSIQRAEKQNKILKIISF